MEWDGLLVFSIHSMTDDAISLLHLQCIKKCFGLSILSYHKARVHEVGLWAPVAAAPSSCSSNNNNTYFEFLPLLALLPLRAILKTQLPGDPPRDPQTRYTALYGTFCYLLRLYNFARRTTQYRYRTFSPTFPQER